MKDEAKKLRSEMTLFDVPVFERSGVTVHNVLGYDFDFRVREDKRERAFQREQKQNRTAQKSAILHSIARDYWRGILRDCKALEWEIASKCNLTARRAAKIAELIRIAFKQHKYLLEGGAI